jgi:uncharacterized membrane protein
MGSWKFVIYQAIFTVVWMIANAVGFIYEWDVYPFIFLNLLFSTQAAFAGPIIMMSQNRQNEMDRAKAAENAKVALESKEEIENLLQKLIEIEDKKLDKIIGKLEIEYKPPTVDEAVLVEIAIKFQEMNKFNGAFRADATSFVRGAEWQSRRFIEQLELLHITMILDQPGVIYEDYMLKEDMRRVEEMLIQLKEKDDERGA